MLFESIICIVVLVTIVAIVLGGVLNQNWDPGMNAVLIAGITAIVLVAWVFLRSAQFATPGSDEFQYFLSLVAIVFCGCCCVCLAGCGGRAVLRAITER